MTGDEIKRIRSQLGLSTLELARALGYEATDKSASVVIRRYESDMRPLPPTIARLVLMFEKHGVPQGWSARLNQLSPTDGSAEEPDERLTTHNTGEHE